MSVLDEITAERINQLDTHGWDDEHDDRVSLAAWAWLLAGRAHVLAHPDIDTADNFAANRRRLVEVAAIAVAAIEALDRRSPQEATP